MGSGVTGGTIGLGVIGYDFWWESNGDALWRHPACRGWNRIDLTSGEHHKLVSQDPITIEGSLFCPQGCGTRGFIRDGKWVSA